MKIRTRTDMKSLPVMSVILVAMVCMAAGQTFANERPVAVAETVGGKTVVNEISDSLQLDGSNSYDPPDYSPESPGGISSYTWSIIDGPTEVMDDPSAYLPGHNVATSEPAATFTPPYGVQGDGPMTVTFHLTVTDTSLLQSENPADVTVRINRRPEAITNGNQYVTEGDPVYLIGTDSFDVDGIGAPEVDSISYHWEEIPEPTVLLPYPGDISRDGKVNFADLELLADQWLLKELSFDLAPIEGDNFVDFLDWAVFADGWQITNDITDLAVFVDQWLQLGPYGADIAPAPDGDGIVNLIDFAVLAKDWLKAGVDIASFVAPDVENVESLTFRLTVTDTNGLQDWEDVTIFIEPLPDIRYVDKANTTGTETGSESYPYTTIQQALDEADLDISIDTIEVRVSVPGEDTYIEDITLRDNLTLRAQEQRDPVTHYRMNMPIIKGTVRMADNSKLEGFRIEKDSFGDPPVIVDSRSGVEIAHNTIKIDANAPNDTVCALDVIDPAFINPDDIIYIHHNIIVTNATGEDCTAWALALRQISSIDEVPQDKIELINNTIDVTTDKYAHGIYADINNFYSHPGAGIYLTGIVVKNNIITVPRSIGRWNLNFCINYNGQEGKKLPVRYNNLFVRDKERDDRVVSSDVLTNPEFLNKYNDPQFSDSLYHLSTDSECIDAGDPLDDYSLEPDYPDGYINMGAYGNTPEAAVKPE